MTTSGTPAPPIFIESIAVRAQRAASHCSSKKRNKPAPSNVYPQFSECGSLTVQTQRLKDVEGRSNEISLVAADFRNGSNAIEPFGADADQCLLLLQERPNRGKVAKDEKGRFCCENRRGSGADGMSSIFCPAAG
jgi:hypothetical protein